jgi:hypothetical protein
MRTKRGPLHEQIYAILAGENNQGNPIITKKELFIDGKK